MEENSDDGDNEDRWPYSVESKMGVPNHDGLVSEKQQKSSGHQDRLSDRTYGPTEGPEGSWAVHNGCLTGSVRHWRCVWVGNGGIGRSRVRC